MSAQTVYLDILLPHCVFVVVFLRPLFLVPVGRKVTAANKDQKHASRNRRSCGEPMSGRFFSRHVVSYREFTAPSRSSLRIIITYPAPNSKTANEFLNVFVGRLLERQLSFDGVAWT